MDAKKLRSIIAEANELGISFIVIAGGEPLTRPEILDITQAFPKITFLVFTNGLLITDETSKRLAKQRNFVPVLSIEGREEETDERRGIGIYQRLQRTIENLQRQSIFWSVSLTITRDNYSTVTDEKFVKYLVDHGCKLFFFVEYIPVSKDTEYRVITNEQRKNLMAIRDSLRSRLSALFIAIPGDEEEIGGCLSAGRGFVHISATGDVEPCPFVPYSDTNIRVVSLKEALMSEFLKNIRENRIQFDKEKGGCTLWQQREWIKSIISDN